MGWGWRLRLRGWLYLVIFGSGELLVRFGCFDDGLFCGIDCGGLGGGCVPWVLGFLRDYVI